MNSYDDVGLLSYLDGCSHGTSYNNGGYHYLLPTVLSLVYGIDCDLIRRLDDNDGQIWAEFQFLGCDALS